MILAEMERRRINEPTRSPEDAWAEFESDYSGRESAYSDFVAASVPPEKAFHADKQCRKRSSKRKAILLAAVICVLLTSLMTVQAAGNRQVDYGTVQFRKNGRTERLGC